MPKCTAMRRGTLRVSVVRQVLLAPRVEPEVDEGDPASRVADEDRTVVAHPRVVDRQRERLDTVPAAVPADLGLLLGIADHDDGLERRDRVGHRRVVALGLVEQLRPESLSGHGGPLHQAGLVVLPFGRHREAVLAWRGLTFAHAPSLAIGSRRRWTVLPARVARSSSVSPTDPRLSIFASGRTCRGKAGIARRRSSRRSDSSSSPRMGFMMRLVGRRPAGPKSNEIPVGSRTFANQKRRTPDGTPSRTGPRRSPACGPGPATRSPTRPLRVPPLGSLPFEGAGRRGG